MAGRTWAIAGDVVPVAAILGAASEDWQVRHEYSDFAARVRFGDRSALVYQAFAPEGSVGHWAVVVTEHYPSGAIKVQGGEVELVTLDGAVDFALTTLGATPAPLPELALQDLDEDGEMVQASGAPPALAYAHGGTGARAFALTGRTVHPRYAGALLAKYSSDRCSGHVFVRASRGERVPRAHLVAALQRSIRMHLMSRGAGAPTARALRELTALLYWAETTPAVA